MDDYIRREDASNWLKQYGQDVLHGKYKFSLMYIWKNIIDLPPADVVPVVRCRNCARLNRNGYCTRFQNNISGIATSWFMPEDDDFCSYGEHREE